MLRQKHGKIIYLAFRVVLQSDLLPNEKQTFCGVVKFVHSPLKPESHCSHIMQKTVCKLESPQISVVRMTRAKFLLEPIALLLKSRGDLLSNLYADSLLYDVYAV